MYASCLIPVFVICFAHGLSAEPINTDLLFKGTTFTANGTNYFVSEVKRNFSEAYDDCQSMGLKLVSIETAEENTVLLQNLELLTGGSDGHYWTSGTKVNNEWTWLSTGKLIDFFNWGEGEPNNDGGYQNCIKIVRDTWMKPGSWDDAQCPFTNYFLCEK